MNLITQEHKHVKHLKDEGYKVILVNSNPATIMTDPGVADKTYIEPISVEVLEEIKRKKNLMLFYLQWVDKQH